MNPLFHFYTLLCIPFLSNIKIKSTCLMCHDIFISALNKHFYLKILSRICTQKLKVRKRNYRIDIMQTRKKFVTTHYQMSTFIFCTIKSIPQNLTLIKKIFMKVFLIGFYDKKLNPLKLNQIDVILHQMKTIAT